MHYYKLIKFKFKIYSGHVWHVCLNSNSIIIQNPYKQNLTLRLQSRVFVLITNNKHIGKIYVHNLLGYTVFTYCKT